MATQNTHRFFLVVVALAAIVFATSGCGTAERMSQNEPAPPPSVPPESPARGVPQSTDTISDLDSKPAADITEFIEAGMASWYGPNFHGKLTANGEEYDMHGMTAAHRTLPFNTLVRVNNRDSNKSVLVRINDRGPFAKNRIIDLSKQAARQIGMIGPGTARVELFVAPGTLENSKTTNLKVASFTIQLASFDNEAQAFTYSSRINGARVEVVQLPNRAVYRVYFGLYYDEAEAQKKLQQLQQKNITGYVKQIENG